MVILNAHNLTTMIDKLAYIRTLYGTLKSLQDAASAINKPIQQPESAPQTATRRKPIADKALDLQGGTTVPVLYRVDLKVGCKDIALSVPFVVVNKMIETVQMEIDSACERWGIDMFEGGIE